MPIVDVVLLLGQSNAGSQGRIYSTATRAGVDSVGINPAEFDQARTDTRIFVQSHAPFGGNNGWQYMDPGNNTQALSPTSSPRGSFGVETTIADRLSADTGRETWIIKAGGTGIEPDFMQSIGGTSLANRLNGQDWNPSSSNELVDQYLNLVTQGFKDLYAANYIPNFRGIVWLQGEADASLGTEQSSYQTLEEELLIGLRETIGTQNVPIVSSLLKTSLNNSRRNVSAVNAAKRANSESIEHYHIVETEDLSFHDNIHYDSKSVIQLGDRIADSLLTSDSLEVPIVDIDISGGRISVSERQYIRGNNQLTVSESYGFIRIQDSNHLLQMQPSMPNSDVFQEVVSVPSTYISGGIDFVVGRGDDSISAVGFNHRTKMRGGLGNDQLMGGNQSDILYGEQDDDFLAGNKGLDRLLGQGGDDILNGGSDADFLNGGTGNDILYGEEGGDRLIGGGGRDILVGGLGQDKLWGKSGADRFVYSSVEESPYGAGTRDLILDFASGLDLIDLSAIDADITTEGHQSFVFQGMDGFSGNAQSLRFSHIGKNTLISASTRGSFEGFQIYLRGNIDLSLSDFIL